MNQELMYQQDQGPGSAAERECRVPQWAQGGAEAPPPIPPRTQNQ